MNKTTPTKQEVSRYFFNVCDVKTARKVEHWFFHHGKSPEASELLLSIWEELDQSVVGQEEAHLAFEEFKKRFTNIQAAPTTPSKPVAKVKWTVWIQRVAAILLLPIIAFTLYQYFYIQEEKTVMWVEKNIPYGESGDITLPDGTAVRMNAGSKIIYPEKFLTNNRQVFFTGEGHFTVAKNKRKPFLVQSNEINVEVLGTEFNLKSYSEDKIIQLSLLNGSVEFVGNTNRNKQINYVLKPGEEVFYDREKVTLWKERFTVDNYSSWKDKKYYFKDVRFEDIAKELERNFNLKIVIKTDSLKDIHFRMAFVNNESLDEILQTIRNADKRMHVVQTGQIVEIYY
ncbi:FecR domain-containing protein [Bacteroides sp. 519]|uniref:FecR domain-containing protein n=1 Tax=Bacteroides sp. 519 TaxID=2302937 RepID=UPI0013D3ADD2|nr:FecR domain-containing protein [Bacteroides sp. 519]NDV58719.1 DUF4974 domain-containing protein [Bacteroides sp. 519]